MIKKIIIIFYLLNVLLIVPTKAAFDINARTAILQDFLSGDGKSSESPDSNLLARVDWSPTILLGKLFAERIICFPDSLRVFIVCFSSC